MKELLYSRENSLPKEKKIQQHFLYLRHLEIIFFSKSFWKKLHWSEKVCMCVQKKKLIPAVD